MDLSFYKMPLLYIFGKVMPNIFPVLRFHQYIYILETVTSKHQVPFLPSTSPNNCEFDSSNKTLAPNKKSEMSHFLHTMPLYILSLVLANRLASQSQGMLPGFKDDEVYMCKYASLAGSHTNAGLRCINAGQYHPIQESKIVSEGRLDLSRVMMVDSTLHDACVHGLRWTVVNAEVAKIVANLRLVYVVEGFFG